jgi:Transglycosylase-like domain
MRTAPPSQRQVYFSAALTAAAVAVASPSAQPSSVTAEMAALKPSRTSEQPVIPEPRAFASYRAARRPAAAPSPSPSASAPRVSDDLESAAVIPSPSPTPSRAAPAPSQAAAAAPYPSYTEVPSQSAAYGSQQGQSGSSGGTSAFQSCVIARESGGNPQVMNSTDHYGLYQFSYSTWVAYGGSPADFGHASVPEQNQVFANAMAAPGGEDNWSPYDHCL